MMPLSLEESQALQKSFAAHIRSPSRNPVPENIPFDRMKVYTDLFFSNIKTFLNDAFPQLRLCVNISWDQLQRSFYCDFKAQSPYFHRISSEFLNYLQKEKCINNALLELADYEQSLFDAEVLDQPYLHKANAGLTLDTDLVLKPGVILKACTYDVESMMQTEKWQDTFLIPLEIPQFYAFFKSNEGKVQALKLAPMTMALLELLREQNSLRSVFTTLSEMTQIPLDHLTDFGFEFLQQEFNRLVVPIV